MGPAMGELLVTLIPVALGVVLSPLAIMALVAVLLSRRASANGIAFLIGWVVGLAGLLALALWLFGVFEVHGLREPPLWVPILRLVIGLFLAGAAVWVYRKGSARIRQMAAASSPQQVVAAAPQLPGWLHAVETFRPVRTGFLGLALFVLNPVDASCAIIAALDISLGRSATTRSGSPWRSWSSGRCPSRCRCSTSRSEASARSRCSTSPDGGSPGTPT